ncbi:MAG: hypothetical protein ACKOZT_15340 [Cyanobium sp.]
MDLQPGSCIRLGSLALAGLALQAGELSAGPAASAAADRLPAEQLYQVIGVDQRGDRCWLRRWPLARHGSPVFEVPLHQLQDRGHRPLPAGR